MMGKLDRKEIHIISRNSNWKENTILKFLEKYVYSDATSWRKFLQILFLSLGVGFSIAGILFFFAYNWDNLHKFAKIGLVEFLIITLTLVTVFGKFKPLFKNVLLTGISILVGVLFAVFGQIYQTGANAYDFFFGWTLAIAVWVFVSDFAPLWLLFIMLINLTFSLYVKQVSSDFSSMMLYTIYSFGNAIFLFFTLFFKEQNFKIPNWFENILVISIGIITTIGMVYGIVEKNTSYFGVLFIVTVLSYSLGIYYGFLKKRSLYLATIPFSIIIMIAAMLMRLVHFDSLEMLFFTGVFVIIATTFMIKKLMDIQKKWRNG